MNSLLLKCIKYGINLLSMFLNLAIKDSCTNIIIDGMCNQCDKGLKFDLAFLPVNEIKETFISSGFQHINYKELS